MFKPSPRALWVASAFTIGAICFAPAASAGLLGSGGGSGALPVSGLSGITGALPLSGDLLAPVQSLLAGGLPGAGLLNAGLLGSNLPLVNTLPVLGGGGLPVLGNGGLPGLGNGGLPGLGSVTGLLGGGLPGLGGTDGSGGQMVDGVFEAVGGTTLACGAAVPQVLQSFAGGVAGSLCEFNPFDGGIVGLLSSL
ncbi:MAG TPA: hypothetical protein VGQ80_12535 [Acidimicrobiia bacterium]|nr:hypothetical protein [Acidimicrobiia bacterium]